MYTKNFLSIYKNKSKTIGPGTLWMHRDQKIVYINEITAEKIIWHLPVKFRPDRSKIPITFIKLLCLKIIEKMSGEGSSLPALSWSSALSCSPFSDITSMKLKDMMPPSLGSEDSVILVVGRIGSTAALKLFRSLLTSTGPNIWKIEAMSGNWADCCSVQLPSRHSDRADPTRTVTSRASTGVPWKIQALWINK